MLSRPRSAFLLLLAALPIRSAIAQPVAIQEMQPPAPIREGRLMYTTYFYTAAEAVIVGYENGTRVRIFALETREPVYAGTVGEGEQVLVPTGAGVFGFVSDKKASILVGTPSACTVVGYWARDPDGRMVADRLFVRLPASSLNADDRVVVWAWEASHVTVRDRATREVLFEGSLPAHGKWVLPHERVAALGAHVLDVRADRPTVAVQVYFDEGFSVPASGGWATGREFMTYVGRTTEGENDLVLTSYHGDAHVRVEDMERHEVLFDGTIEAGQARGLTMHEKYVHVVADREIATAVAPYIHYTGPYAEHHFAGGAEGTGIDTDFLVTSPQELWLFSYFDGNHVTVENARTRQRVWEGTLAAGGSHGLQPGQGLYRIRASAGTSVIGGSMACGGEYSPAGRLFAVDEAILRAVRQVRQQRIEAAAAHGETLSPAQAAAPLSARELDQVTTEVQRSTGSRVFAAPAVQQRMESMEVR